MGLFDGTDGGRIVFRSGREGNHDVYLMDADGRRVRRLTDPDDLAAAKK